MKTPWEPYIILALIGLRQDVIRRVNEEGLFSLSPVNDNQRLSQRQTPQNPPQLTGKVRLPYKDESQYNRKQKISFIDEFDILDLRC